MGFFVRSHGLRAALAKGSARKSIDVACRSMGITDSVSLRVIGKFMLVRTQRVRPLDSKFTFIRRLVGVDDLGDSCDQEQLSDKHFGERKTLARVCGRNEVSVTRRRERREREEQVLSEGPVALGTKESRCLVRCGGSIHEREEHPDEQICRHRTEDGFLIYHRPANEMP